MTIYSLETRKAVIKAYLAGKCGIKALSVQFDVPARSIREWVAKYQVHGLKSIRTDTRAYTADFKLQVLMYKKQHALSLVETSAHFNIGNSSTISRWQKLYNQGDISALRARHKGRPKMSESSKPYHPVDKSVEEMTREELLQELLYRRAEVDYLKKLDALIQSRKPAPKNGR